MAIDDFIEKTKVTISNDLINYVIDGFLKSNLVFYKPNSSLMLYLENDKNNRGKVSRTQIDNFINRLMLDRLKNKYGEDNYQAVDEATRIKDSRTEIDDINAIFKKHSFVNITRDAKIEGSSLKYDHTFIINTKPEDYAEVLEELYIKIKELNSDDVYMVACSPNYVGLGYSSPIKINCKVDVLENVLNMLDGMKHSFTSKTKKVLPIYNRMNTWYGYDQYDSYNDAEASSIFTMAIFQALQKTFYMYLDQDVEINGMLIKDYYDSKSNKLQAMRDIINNSIALEDALISNIILNTRNELSAFGLTTTNILNVPAVEVRMELWNSYGPEEASEMLASESTLEEDIPEETILEETPETVSEEAPKEVPEETIPEEVTREDVPEEVEIEEKVGKIEVAEVIPVSTSIVMEGKREETNKIDSQDVKTEEVVVDENSSGEDLVLRTKEEARDEDILESINGEITQAVEDVVERMRKAAENLPDVTGIEEIGEEQYEDLSNAQQQQEKIEKTKEAYANLGEELEEQIDVPKEKEEIVIPKERTADATELSAAVVPDNGNNLGKVDDDSYFVNAKYLIKFADDFDENRVDKDKLSPEELAALKETSMATLNDSLNRLVDAIKAAEEETRLEGKVKEEITDDRLEKYAYIVEDLSNLRKKIKNSNQTLLEYFEAEEIEKNVVGNEILIFHDHSKKTIKQFVNEYLINYLVNFGSHELSYILALYADSIEQPEVKKK